jgi:hypothetical protein
MIRFGRVNQVHRVSLRTQFASPGRGSAAYCAAKFQVSQAVYLDGGITATQ